MGQQKDWQSVQSLCIINWNYSSFIHFTPKTAVPVVNHPIHSQQISAQLWLFSPYPRPLTTRLLKERGSRVTFMSALSIIWRWKIIPCVSFLLGQIAPRIDVIDESQMKWTWHDNLVVEWVSFYRRSKVVLFQTYIYKRGSDRREGLRCLAAVTVASQWAPWRLKSPSYRPTVYSGGHETKHQT